MKSVSQIVREALIKEIEYLRNFCRPEQLSAFDQHYNPYGGIEKLPEETLKQTLNYVQDIVRNNFVKQ